MSLTSPLIPPSPNSPQRNQYFPLHYNTGSTSPKKNASSSASTSTLSTSPNSSPDKNRSRSNTLTNGLPSRNGHASGSGSNHNGAGYGYGYGYNQSTKSAPTSPSGRITMNGLTPISNIHGIQLDQAQTQLLLAQAAGRQVTPQSHSGQHGLMGPPSSLPSHNAHARPSHIHSQSLTSTHPIHQLPPSSFHSPSTAQHAGPSRQPTFPIANSSHTSTSVKPLMRVRPRQPLGKQNAEDSGIDSDATVRPMRGDETRHKGSLSQPDLTALRSKRVEGWTENLKGNSNRASPPTSASSQGSGDVNDGIASGVRRRPSHHRQKTPPSRTIQPLSESQIQPPNREVWLPASPTNSRSNSSLVGLRKSPSTSPRHSQLSIPTMSPITPNRPITPLGASSSSEEDEAYVSLISHGYNSRSNPGISTGFPIPIERGMSSEDADDDYETNSNSNSNTSEEGSSSGSITFSPKRTKSKFGSASNPNLSLRNRFLQEKDKDKRSSSITIESSPTSSISTGLGLTLNDHDEDHVSSNRHRDDLHSKSPEPKSKQRLSLLDKLENWFQRSTLLPLRLLAVVPSLWGICVLSQAIITGGLWVDVWPWGVDLTREALERLVAGGEGAPGIWRRVDRGDVVLCIAWAICTAHFCFSLTTGLTHRWRSYYSLPSTITRLVSLQCLCWPATYLTLWFLGTDRLLLCWVVIGVTTGWSRTIQMWVTSNVIPIPIDQRHHQRQRQNNEGPGSGGDLTPNLKRGIDISMNIIGNGPPEIPEGLSMWESFIWGRKWDWDNVAREVGWKVGTLLLVTCAWLFWGIEKGTRIRV